MLVFFIIISIICLLVLTTYFSTIKIEIETLKIEKDKKLSINDFKIKTYLFLGKINWFKLEINKQKLEKMKNENYKKLKEKITNINIMKYLKEKKILNNKSGFLEAIKDTKIKIERLNLDVLIGLENIILLSYLVAIIDIIISVNLAKKAKNSADNYKYVITPCKTNRIYFNLSINCIISIKIANIINIILKKRGKNNERTSNRIFNGNSHEQHSRYGRRKYNNRRANLYRL